MVDTLRAALRLLPAVKPSLSGGPCGSCSRVSRARLHSTASEQPALLNLKTQQQQIVVYEKNYCQEDTVIVRFARAVLKYVGAGLSAVAANQFAYPSVCQAKELGQSVGENHMMAAAEARALWQRTGVNRHLAQEDVARSPKFSNSHLPHIISKVQNDVCLPMGHSYHWSNSSWGSVDARLCGESKLDYQRSLSSSFSKDFRGEAAGLDELNCSRFCKPAGLQALAVETNATTKASGALVAASEDTAGTDLELEWQLIVDTEPKTSIKDSKLDRKMSDDLSFFLVELAECKSGREESAEALELPLPASSTPRDMNKGITEGVASGCSSDIEARETEKERPGALSRSVETAEHPEMNFSSASKSHSSWRTADKEALAALVASRSGERLENCDLPTPHAAVALNSLSSFDLGPRVNQGTVSTSLDSSLLASVLGGNEPTRLENVGLPASPFSFGGLDGRPSVRAKVSKVSQPLAIPSTQPQARRVRNISSDSRNTRWSGSEISSTMERSSGLLLGEALCHSQTRAREAEKKVEQAKRDRERLVDMFFREASLSLTYRQWANFLHYENMWLRMYAGDEPITWLEQSLFNPFSAFERFAKNRWKDMGKELSRQMGVDNHLVTVWRDKDLAWHGESSDMVMGCTLGFAFALGISLAGAGLMLGWSMGWILLAC